MNTILDKIVLQKMKEVQEVKTLIPVKKLESSLYFDSPCISLADYLLKDTKNGIIAEFKRKSPSKGNINLYATVEETTTAYMQANVSALSILTDQQFFGGTKDELTAARKLHYCPILRKDFIINEYQVLESKAIGADAILLIARILTKKEIKHLSDLAFSLGMEVLLEIHEEEELFKIGERQKIIGVNNRDLNSFSVEFEKSIALAEHLPSSLIKVAESGIKSAANIKLLKKNGFDGFLIGQQFMKHENPGEYCKQFTKKITHVKA